MWWKVSLEEKGRYVVEEGFPSMAGTLGITESKASFSSECLWKDKGKEEYSGCLWGGELYDWQIQAEV